MAKTENTLTQKMPGLVGIDSDEIDAALEKGWQDMISGRTIPAREVFASLKKEYNLADSSQGITNRRIVR